MDKFLLYQLHSRDLTIPLTIVVEVSLQKMARSDRPRSTPPKTASATINPSSIIFHSTLPLLIHPIRRPISPSRHVILEPGLCRTSTMPSRKKAQGKLRNTNARKKYGSVNCPHREHPASTPNDCIDLFTIHG